MVDVRISPSANHVRRARCLSSAFCHKWMIDLSVGIFQSAFCENNLSCMTRLVRTLSVQNDMKGMSFGLMKECPHINGWNKNNSVVANAVQFENHLLVM